MEYYEIYLDDASVEHVLLASSSYNPGLLNPTVQKEVNTAGSLSFSMIKTHPQIDSITRYKSRIDVIIYGNVIFRGRVTSISEDFYGQKSFECEGALAYLMDSTTSKLKVTNIYKKIRTLIVQGHNNQVEFWKRFETGIYENEGSANLIRQSDLKPGMYKWNTDEYVNDDRYVHTGLLPFHDDYKYYISVPKFLRSLPNGFCYINVYDSNENYLQPSEYPIEAQYGQLIPSTYYNDYAGNYIIFTFEGKEFWGDDSTSGISTKPSYFRLSITDPHEDIWIQEKASDVAKFTDDDASETDSLQSTGDTFSNCYIDGRTNMFRTRVYNDTIYLDCLNGKRVDSGYYHLYGDGSNKEKSEIEFGVNLIDLNRENSDIEPYSVATPISNGEGYEVYKLINVDTGHGVTEQITVRGVPHEEALQLFGVIAKTVDVGTDSNGNKLSYESAEKRIKKFFKLYDPVIPSKMTIKALDKGLFFDQEKFYSIDVGDPVHIFSEPHNIDRYLVCLSLTFDVMNPQNNEYVVGEYSPEGESMNIQSLTKSFAKTKK